MQKTAVKSVTPHSTKLMFARGWWKLNATHSRKSPLTAIPISSINVPSTFVRNIKSSGDTCCHETNTRIQVKV
jgi:hypothetical protein